MKAPYLTIVVGLVLIPLAWVGCFSNEVPWLICPMPIVTVIPAFMLASPPLSSHLPYWLAVLVPTLLFFAWNPGLFRGNSRVPTRSWVILVVLSGLTGFYFVRSWRDGTQYQGGEYTIAILIVNILCIVFLWAILYRSWRLASFGANLLFHAALFAWLAWCAFPYLGELP